MNAVDQKLKRIPLRWPEIKILNYFFDCVMNTSYATLSSGVPWNVLRVTCILTCDQASLFLKGRRITCYLFFPGIYASLFTPREHCMTISYQSIKIVTNSQRDIHAAHDGKVRCTCTPVKYTTVFLCSDFLCFL